MHAWRLAEDVGIPTIAVPPRPASPARRACSRQTSSTCTCRASSTASTAPLPPRSRRGSSISRARARRHCRGRLRRDELQLNRQIDLRYPHQGYELAMDCPFETPSDGRALRLEFDRLDEREIYGVAAPDELVEIVNAPRADAVVPVRVARDDSLGARRHVARRGTNRRASRALRVARRVSRPRRSTTARCSAPGPSSRAPRSSSSSTRPPSSAPAGRRRPTVTETS